MNFNDFFRPHLIVSKTIIFLWFYCPIKFRIYLLASDGRKFILVIEIKMDWQLWKKQGFEYKSGKYILPQYKHMGARCMVEGVHWFGRLGKVYGCQVS